MQEFMGDVLSDVDDHPRVPLFGLDKETADICRDFLEEDDYDDVATEAEPFLAHHSIGSVARDNRRLQFQFPSIPLRTVRFPRRIFHPGDLLRPPSPMYSTADTLDDEEAFEGSGSCSPSTHSTATSTSAVTAAAAAAVAAATLSPSAACNGDARRHGHGRMSTSNLGRIFSPII
jgi:hypothetical protein